MWLGAWIAPGVLFQASSMALCALLHGRSAITRIFCIGSVCHVFQLPWWAAVERALDQQHVFLTGRRRHMLAWLALSKLALLAWPKLSRVMFGRLTKLTRFVQACQSHMMSGQGVIPPSRSLTRMPVLALQEWLPGCPNKNDVGSEPATQLKWTRHGYMKIGV